MNKAIMFSTGNNEIETPPALFKKLHHEFDFALDVCASAKNKKCDHYFNLAQDAMRLSWAASVPPHSAVWMNPPYSPAEAKCKPVCKKKKCLTRGHHVFEKVPGQYEWVKKACHESRQGLTVVCLLPSRTDTRLWHDWIWDADLGCFRLGVEVRFLSGRLTFVGCKDPAPFPSIIVIFRQPHLPVSRPLIGDGHADPFSQPLLTVVNTAIIGDTTCI